MLELVIVVVEIAFAFLALQELHAKEVRLLLLLSLSLLLLLYCKIGTCPSDCSGHGQCVTIKDLSLFDGPDYDSAVQFAGDGVGLEYTNWDKNSITICNCDVSYFGPDCSLGNIYIYNFFHYLF